MYPYGYRRRGFHWLPLLFGFLFLVMLFSGGFHRGWFFVWPLFCVAPFVLLAGAAFLFKAHWGHGGPYKRHYGEYEQEEKPKRTSDSESDIYYV